MLRFTSWSLPRHGVHQFKKKLRALASQTTSLTELVGVGSSIARKILRWFDSPLKAEPPPKRQEFLTLAQA